MIIDYYRIKFLIRNIAQAIIIILFLYNTADCQNYTQYVNCFTGTCGGGNTFPGAVAPFGMIQWSPDTKLGRQPGGYSYNDSRIYGFSLDHLSGAGCLYGGNFAFMPLPGNAPPVAPGSRSDFASPFLHKDESAKPGYYSVKLNNGVKIELTVATRTGFGRFTFPKGSYGTMMIDAASAVRGARSSSIKINKENQSVSGSAKSQIFCGRSGGTIIYFYAVFDHPFSSFSTWNGRELTHGKKDVQGKNTGAFVTFNILKDKTILVRVAVSYVSVKNAKENLYTEIPDSNFTTKGFDKVVKNEGNRWNSWLSKIEISGGTISDLQTFYTTMYHALIAPTVCSDVNNEYMGYDGKIHKTLNGRKQYANFSGWDIYRSECQFLAMIAPKETSDMAQSLLVDYQQGGAFPRWGVPNDDSGVMVGDPAGPMIADFYAFGARNFDVKDALTGLIKAATDPTVFALRTNIYERDALKDYLKLGYVPEYLKSGHGPVATTLEYNTADFAVSRLALSMGDSVDSKRLLNNAQNWRNLFNPATGYIQMKRDDGSWAPNFVDNNEYYNNYRVYVEGSAAQYVWMVPFNLRGLAEKMGGQAIASSRLDTFFTKLNAGPASNYAWMGNEPCMETPWIYDFLGQPYKTQRVVHRIILRLFSAKPNGIPGNDDLGAMSSWYIFSSLGFFPELPGTGILVLGSPLFSKAIIHLKNGDIIIKGKKIREDELYIQSLTVNGKQWNKPWISFSDISHGGTLIYYLDSVPNKSWGSSPKDAPPSYN